MSLKLYCGQHNNKNRRQIHEDSITWYTLQKGCKFLGDQLILTNITLEHNQIIPDQSWRRMQARKQANRRMQGKKKKKKQEHKLKGRKQKKKKDTDNLFKIY